jgi:hypothetical protein
LPVPLEGGDDTLDAASEGNQEISLAWETI